MSSEDHEEQAALHFLTKYMPAHDRASLSVTYLISNVKIALQVHGSDDIIFFQNPVAHMLLKTNLLQNLK